MSENELPDLNRDDIREIKNAMLKHFRDDEKEFDQINKSLSKINVSMEKDKVSKDSLHNDLHEDIRRLQTSIDQLTNKVTPVVKWFDNITFGKSALMWILGLLATVVGIILGIRSFFK